MTDWEQRYQDQDTPWDKGSAAPPLTELLNRNGSGIFSEGRVIVPGCGVGHDVRALAHQGVAVLGVDLAVSAVNQAKAYPRVEAESYEVGDVLDPCWRANRQGEFTAWWEHTCFCAIDPERRGDYARAAGELIQANGFLAGVFFITPYDSGEDASGPPFETTVDEVIDGFSRWFEPLDGWVPESAYPGREGREWIGVFRRLSNP